MPATDNLRAGDLRRRLTIQNLVETADTFGAAGTESWVTLQTVWADIEPLSGRETLMAQQTEAQVNTRIRIRFLTGIKAKARGTEDQTVGTVVYDFQSVIPDARRCWIEIMALQRNA